MKKFVTRLSAFALIVMVGLHGCKDEDSESCTNGTFEMTLNGEQFTAVSFDNTLFKGNSAGTDGKRMDIRATNEDGKTVIVTFTDLSSGTSGDGVTTDEYIAFDDVTTGTENVFLFTIMDGDMSYSFIDGEFDVTSCDADAKQVSGTFSFADGEMEVTNGAFTNMCYRILK